MVRRSTWILLAVFAVLVGFALFFQNYQAKKSTNLATATPTESKARLYNIDGTQVNELNIANSSGNKLDLYRDSADSQWSIKDVPADKVDKFQIESISAQLFSIQVQQSLTQTPPLDSVGLITPAYTITMTETNGSRLVTFIGAQTPIGNGYYVRIGTGPVVTVDKVTMNNVLDMLTNPPLLPTSTPDAISIEEGTPTVIFKGTPTP
jgi:hypothetical protein